MHAAGVTRLSMLVATTRQHAAMNGLPVLMLIVRPQRIPSLQDKEPQATVHLGEFPTDQTFQHAYRDHRSVVLIMDG
jgi:hypothetical protein